jgi:hypothetical protein
VEYCKTIKIRLFSTNEAFCFILSSFLKKNIYVWTGGHLFATLLAFVGIGGGTCEGFAAALDGMGGGTLDGMGGGTLDGMGGGTLDGMGGGTGGGTTLEGTGAPPPRTIPADFAGMARVSGTAMTPKPRSTTLTTRSRARSSSDSSPMLPPAALIWEGLPVILMLETEKF